MHKAPNLAQPTRTGARARPYRGAPSAVSWARRLCGGRVRVQARLYRGLPRDTTACLKPPLVTIHPIVLRYNSQLPSSFWSQYSLCIVIQCPRPSSLPQSQYTNCIAIQFSTASSPVTIHLVYCNTFPLAKQTLPTCNTPWCIAIQFLSLQDFSCNTILCQKYN